MMNTNIFIITYLIVSAIYATIYLNKFDGYVGFIKCFLMGILTPVAMFINAIALPFSWVGVNLGCYLTATIDTKKED